MLSVRNSSQVSTHFNFITKKVNQASTKIESSSTNRAREIMQKVNNDSESLKEELAACQHLLDDMHAEHDRQEVFNFSLSDLDTRRSIKNLMKFLQTSTVLQKLT